MSLGISASIYHEDGKGRRLPLGHITRTTGTEMEEPDCLVKYGQVRGIMMSRQYLVGNRFTSWGDHKTIKPLFNDLNKLKPVQIAKHRSKMICFTFTEKYMLGRNMPADDNPQHPKPITNTHLSQQEREDIMMDDGEDVQIHTNS